MRLHAEVDGGILLAFAGEDLGDDAFHLAAITLFEQPTAPGADGVASNDPAGHASHSAFDKFALDDGLAVGSTILGPGNHAGQHHSHAARREGGESDSTQVEAVIRDHQTVAERGTIRFSLGTRKLLKTRP